MNHPLQTIDWRIERANEHLATLNDVRNAFVNQKHRRIVGHFERETSEYVFRFEGELPDPRIGLIVGEFGHHLRAALDNLVWQLVRLRGGSPTRRTEFPIYESRKRYRQGARLALRGVSADDRAAIDAVQPYNHGESAPESYLAHLAWLNNMDKHRFLHVNCILPQTTGIKVSYGSEGTYAGQFPWNPWPVKHVGKIIDVQYVPALAGNDRAELMRVRIEATGPNPEMKVNRGAEVQIALSDPEHALILADLKLIRENVVGVIEGFRPRFDLVVGLTE